MAWSLSWFNRVSTLSLIKMDLQFNSPTLFYFSVGQRPRAGIVAQNGGGRRRKEEEECVCGENEVSGLVLENSCRVCFSWSFHGVFHDQYRLLYDKVTVLESEKRAWESSPEAQAIRDALNPWRHQDAETRKNS